MGRLKPSHAASTHGLESFEPHSPPLPPHWSQNNRSSGLRVTVDVGAGEDGAGVLVAAGDGAGDWASACAGAGVWVASAAGAGAGLDDSAGGAAGAGPGAGAGSGPGEGVTAGPPLAAATVYVGVKPGEALVIWPGLGAPHCDSSSSSKPACGTSVQVLGGCACEREHHISCCMGHKHYTNSKCYHVGLRCLAGAVQFRQH
jgi:hypothetical protein